MLVVVVIVVMLVIGPVATLADFLDYVTKPFGIHELLARMRAVQRRKRKPGRSTLLNLDGVIVDFETHRITGSDRDEHLTPKEFVRQPSTFGTDHTWKPTVRWQIDPVRHERKLVTLIARLNVSNDGFQDVYMIPEVDRQSRFGIALRDGWLERGERLYSLSQFCELVGSIRERKRYFFLPGRWGNLAEHDTAPFERDADTLPAYLPTHSSIQT